MTTYYQSRMYTKREALIKTAITEYDSFIRMEYYHHIDDGLKGFQKLLNTPLRELADMPWTMDKTSIALSYFGNIVIAANDYLMTEPDINADQDITLVEFFDKFANKEVL